MYRDKKDASANKIKKDLEMERMQKMTPAERAALARDGGEDEFGDGGDAALDATWARVRDFLNDVGAAGVKKDVRPEDSNRQQFIKFCSSKDTSRMARGVISKREVLDAFVAAKLSPPLADKEADKLFSALDAWSSKENLKVDYNRILSALAGRSTISRFGLFPKVVAPGPSKLELERKAQAEAEAKAKKAAMEEERKKMEQAQVKRLAARGAQPSGKPLSKEER